MIEFDMVYSPKISNALLKRQLKKLIWFYLAITIIMIGLATILLLTNEKTLAVFCIAFGVLYGPICILMSKYSSKQFDRKMSFSGENAKVRYTFSEDMVVITQSKGKEFRAVMQVKYSHFAKVEDTKDFLFLYVATNQCYVVEKACLVTGDLVALKNIFMKEIPQKYVIAD